MNLRIGLFIISACLIIGCVNKNLVGFDPNLEWSIRGKISVSTSEFTGVYNFAVFNKNEANEIVVSTLFGIELYRIRLLPTLVSVEDSFLDRFSSQPKELDKNLLKNLRFIWGWLPYWAAGQDKFGQPLQMAWEEDGWRVDLSGYNGSRPRAIILKKRDIRAKLMISDFENLI